MKTLASLLTETALISDVPESAASLRVKGLAFDSRKVSAGDLFFAFSGLHHDGNRYAEAALRAGAVAVVSEQASPAGFPGLWLRVPQARKAMGTIGVALYAELLQALRLIGITGTNGKTTTAWLLDAILRFGGAPTALIGTVLYRLANELLPSPNTTPESSEVLRLGAELAQRGGRFLTMEVSSHGLALGRAHALPFEVAVFTNFTQDHLDFHGSLEEYFNAKCLLFDSQRATTPRVAVLNADDSAVAKTPTDSATSVIRFGLNETCELRARNIHTSLAGQPGALMNGSGGGLDFEVCWQGKWQRLHSPLVGEFNVYNLLAAYGAALACGITQEQIHEALAGTTGVPGRFERVDLGQPFTVIVDYAHTPDALRNVL
jgi:UDP-N-acetylmuramoyl-L-alanyl-D-glutamate--2,6-diaminopimelate ligase